jgi:two-component system, chemotaxis family, chemotaxis protein CheY
MDLMLNQTTRNIRTALLIARTDALRSMLAELLVGAGYHVLPAQDVCIGGQPAPKRPVNVAVIEVSPPVDRDLGVLQGLRSHPATRDIPVVVVTTQATTVLEPDDTGARVIAMPFDIDDVLVHVNRVVEYTSEKTLAFGQRAGGDQSQLGGLVGGVFHHSSQWRDG